MPYHECRTKPSAGTRALDQNVRAARRTGGRGETPRQALPENSLRNSASKFLAMYANISGDCAVAALRGAFGRMVYRTAGHFCIPSTQQCLCPEITPHSSIIIDATRQTGKLAFFIP